VKRCICCNRIIDGAFGSQKYCINCSLYIKNLNTKLSRLSTANKLLKKRIFIYKSNIRIEDAKQNKL